MTCRTCKGFKVVRAAGKRKGLAYYTENGAQTALASMPCPACSPRPHQYERDDETRTVSCLNCHRVYRTLHELENAGSCPAVKVPS